MGRPGYIFGQFRETARCRDAQHGDGVCCAFAPQLVTKFVEQPILRMFHKLVDGRKVWWTRSHNVCCGGGTRRRGDGQTP